MTCKFQDIWLKDEQFANWLGKKDNRTARCNICHLDIDISNLEKTGLTRHQSGRKHKERLPVDFTKSAGSIKNFFSVPAAKLPSTSTTSTTKTDQAASSSSKQQTSISSCIESQILGR